MSLAPPANSVALLPGHKLDRYELLCPIAEGGMASVWVARLLGKHGFEKLVAIKTILPKFAADLRFQQMFLDEARIACGIEHMNVVQILDLGEESEVLYIVMEWVDGDALSKLHRGAARKGMKVPIGIVLRILADACAGLHAAHELCDKEGKLLGVVHRDVSPQNVLVSTRGVAKVIDFGIAKARDRLAGETSTGLLKGKIQYMAPEQAIGKNVDCRADLWAIGAILYHLVTGKTPYDGENQLATLHMLTSGDPPEPLPEGTPPAIQRLIDKTLAYDRDKRYPTAAELGRAIEAAMQEIGAYTTPADVAAFAAEHLAERAEARKKAVAAALEAAAERARVATGSMAMQTTIGAPPESASETSLPLVVRASRPDLGFAAPDGGHDSGSGSGQPSRRAASGGFYAPSETGMRRGPRRSLQIVNDSSIPAPPSHASAVSQAGSPSETEFEVYDSASHDAAGQYESMRDLQRRQLEQMREGADVHSEISSTLHAAALEHDARPGPRRVQTLVEPRPQRSYGGLPLFALLALLGAAGFGAVYLVSSRGSPPPPSAGSPPLPAMTIPAPMHQSSPPTVPVVDHPQVDPVYDPSRAAPPPSASAAPPSVDPANLVRPGTPRRAP